MILVDSSVWIDYFNGKPTWQTDLLSNYLSSVPIIMGDLILTEVLSGFRSEKAFNTAKTLLDELPFCQLGGCFIAVESARNYRKLRKTGIVIRKTIDVIIATYCIIEGLTLLHDDHDFDPIASHLPLEICAPK